MGIGLTIIGAGKIGTHRARLAAHHVGYGWIAIADRDAARAEALATAVGDDLWTADLAEAVHHS